MDELPIITNEDDWLDLRTGETALLRGLLYAATHKGLVVTFPDWTDVYVEAPYGDNCQHLIRQQIEIPVTRTEDGLSASQEQTRAARKLR